MAYRKIGSFVTQINEKNTDGKYSNVLGVAIEKEFMPSVANIIGTDLRKYNIVRKNRYAFNPMHVGRDKKLPIAIYRDEEPSLVSPAYTMFEISDESVNETYLMLVFKTEVFDHLCWFYTDASVRGGLTWEDFSNIEINIPDLEEQEKVVRQYNTIAKRMDILNQINSELFNQAVAIYRNMFSIIDEQNDFIGTYMIPKRGKNLILREVKKGDVPVVAGGVEASGYHNVANTNAPVVTISASGANAGYVNLWNIPVWSSDSSYIDNSITNNVFFWYVTLKMRQKEIFDFQTGSAQPHIYPQHIAELPIIKLKNKDVEKFESIVSPLFEEIWKNKQEVKLMKQMLFVLNSKLC